MATSREKNATAEITKNSSLEWHHLDATHQVLGRLATTSASLLLGKHRLDARPNSVAPVYVVITNTDKIVVTGRKETDKMYRRYTGYPGGLRSRNVAEQRKRDSRRIVYEAVRGMLPKNKLRTSRLQHLKLYPGNEHPHLPQIKNEKAAL